MADRYKTGLFGYQKEFFKMKGPLDLLRLEGLGDLMDTVYLDPPKEVSVYGDIYTVSEYKDYVISDEFHYLVLDATPLGDMNGLGRTNINLTAIDLPEESPYLRVKEIINSGDAQSKIESLSPASDQINKYFAVLLISEVIWRAQILSSLEELLEENNFNGAVEMLAGATETTTDDLEDYFLRSVDVQADESQEALLETAEYKIQSPFSGVLGIYNKKTGQVRLLTPDSLSADAREWGDCLGRDLWNKAGEEEFAKEALVRAAEGMIGRSLVNLKLSLYNLGLNIDGTKAFFLKRYFGKKILRRSLKNSR